jgi:hypothetical protein
MVPGIQILLRLCARNYPTKVCPLLNLRLIIMSPAINSFEGDFDNAGVTTYTTGSNRKHSQEFLGKLSVNMHHFKDQDNVMHMHAFLLLHTVIPISVSASIGVVFLFLVVSILVIGYTLFVIRRRKRCKSAAIKHDYIMITICV